MSLFAAFFLKYILFPLLLIIMAVVFSIIKKGRSLLSMRRLIIFVLLTGIFIAVPIVFLGLFDIYFYPTGLLLTHLYFFFFGFMLVQFTYTDLFESIGFDDNLVFFMMALIVSMMLGGWLHFIIFERLNELDYTPMVSMGVIWIFTPFFLKWAEDAFVEIPPKIYKLWYPAKNTDYDYWETIDLRRLREATIRVRRDPDDPLYSNLDAKIPEGVSIGQWFNRFIEDHDIKFPDTPVSMRDERDEFYGWVFYKKRFLPIFNQPIDFEKNTQTLKIKDNSTIIAKRVVEANNYDDSHLI